MRSYADDSALQTALRETHDMALSHTFLVWLAVATMILTITGPFGTYDHFNWLERLAYWGILAPTTFLIANFTATIIVNYLEEHIHSFWLRYIIAGVVAGIPVGIFVWTFGVIIQQVRPYSFHALAELIPLAIMMTLPVTLLFGYHQLKHSAQEDNLVLTSPNIDIIQNELSHVQTPSAFLDRLPKYIGRDLISLNAQDHYIKVVTDKGSTMILLRLSDAISELTSYDGFQTHRSWWVAREHIAQLSKENGRQFLIMSNGVKAPISRTYWKQIKASLKPFTQG